MVTQLVSGCPLIGTQGRTAVPCVFVSVGLVVNLLKQQLSLVSLSLWSSWLMLMVGRINTEKNPSPCYPKGHCSPSGDQS